MPVGSCWGGGNKRRICGDYLVTPVVHLRALAGEPKPSCAGRIVETWFYMFRAQHRASGEVENFFAGDHAANEFLRILNLAPLPRFDPLLGEEHETDLLGDGELKNSRKPGEAARTPLNRELFQATRLFLYWQQKIPGPSLSGLIGDIDKRLGDERNRAFVKSLNTMLARYPLTLRQMIDDLATRGNHLRPFVFSSIRAAVSELGLSDHLGF